MGPTGCGDSGTPTSISADPESLAFVVDKSAPFVAVDQGVAEQSQSQTITIDFVGDGVVAGYAPGVMPRDWLSIETATATADSATFVLKARAAYMSEAGGHGGYTLGSHDSVSMRFVTGRLPENQDLQQATQIVYVDVPVTFSVVGFSALPTSLSFAGTVDTAGIPVSLSFQLDGALPVTAPNTPAVPVEWTATTDQPWLTLMTSSGTTPAGVSVAPDTAGLGAGVYQANVTVTGGGLIPLKVPVTLTLTAP
jgi:hypothetical protein